MRRWSRSRSAVHLAGRLDGMINTGSYHVYPQQVEEAIRAVSGVAAVQVLGEPDPVWGEAVTAFVIPEDPGQWDALVERLRGQLPGPRREPSRRLCQHRTHCPEGETRPRTGPARLRGALLRIGLGDQHSTNTKH